MQLLRTSHHIIDINTRNNVFIKHIHNACQLLLFIIYCFYQSISDIVADFHHLKTIQLLYFYYFRKGYRQLLNILYLMWCI